MDTFGFVQRTLFFGLIVAATVVFAWLLSPLFMPLFWAVVLALLLYSPYQWLRRKLGDRESLAALLVILLALLIFFIPVSTIGTLVTKEALDAYATLADKGFSPRSLIDHMPFIQIIESYTGDTNTILGYASDVLRAGSAWMASQTLALGSATVSFIIQFFLMVYLLFFFLRDGERLAFFIMKSLPLGDARERLLFARFASTTRAIIKGTVVVALVQGLIGAILFAIVGIPSPLLWGTLMALLALIPAVGPSLIWAPAAVILLLTGNIMGAIILIAGGVLVISLVDNVLRPLLVGRDTEMPDALVLLSLLGGLASFGLAGIVIGPVIAALFLAIWELFVHEYSEDLEMRG